MFLTIKDVDGFCHLVNTDAIVEVTKNRSIYSNGYEVILSCGATISHFSVKKDEFARMVSVLSNS